CDAYPRNCGVLFCVAAATVASIAGCRKLDRKRLFILTTSRPSRLAAKLLQTISRWLAFPVRFAKARSKPPLTLKQKRKFRFSIRAATFGQSIFNGTACALSD